MKIDVLIPSRKLPFISILGLLGQKRKPDRVLIWADKVGESNLALEYLADLIETEIFIQQSENIGQKRKEFIFKSNADFVWLLDDDAFPLPDCLSIFTSSIQKGKSFYQGMCLEPEGMIFKGEREWEIITGKEKPVGRLRQGDTKNMFCQVKAFKNLVRNDKRIEKLPMFEHTYLTKKMKEIIFVPKAKVYHFPSKESFSRSLDFYLNSKKLIDLILKNE
jgi:hypothetical protein